MGAKRYFIMCIQCMYTILSENGSNGWLYPIVLMLPVYGSAWLPVEVATPTTKINIPNLDVEEPRELENIRSINKTTIAILKCQGCGTNFIKLLTLYM